MRQMRLGTPLLLLAVSACETAPRAPASQLDADTRAAIATEVRETVDGLFEAMNAHDADRVLEHYGEAPDLLYVGGMTPQFGWDRVSGVVRAWVVEDSAVTVTHETIHLQVLSPTTATALSRGAYSNSEKPILWTHVLVRSDDGRWRIMLEQEIWPGVSEVRGPHPM